jgi:hypothetical protein
MPWSLSRPSSADEPHWDEIVAMRSQLTFYEESIRQKRQPRPRFNPTFRLLWVLLSSVWTGCMSMPFSNGGAGNLDGKEAVQPSARKWEC